MLQVGRELTPSFYDDLAIVSTRIAECERYGALVTRLFACLPRALRQNVLERYHRTIGGLDGAGCARDAEAARLEAIQGYCESEARPGE